ncbi:MAG TPA: LPS-assembly protein LptD, partial [Thiomicrospira sp.]|nr:LPS-assembly protein LptD [Thiomicrospira sp.]
PRLIAPLTAIPQANTKKQAVADSMLKNSAGEYHLEGEVKIQQPGLVIRSNKIIINQQQQTIQAKGNIEIHSKDMVVTGEKANINRQNNTAEIINPKYQLSNSKAHGQSSQIQLDKADMLSTLKEASFTTCKLTKIQWQARPDIIKSNQQYDWILDFNVLTIDDAKQRIYGKNTVLTFKKVPILYSPYISFSTAKRATGLLFPSFGSYKSITQPTAETYLSVP